MKSNLRSYVLLRNSLTVVIKKTKKHDNLTGKEYGVLLALFGLTMNQDGSRDVRNRRNETQTLCSNIFM